MHESGTAAQILSKFVILIKMYVEWRQMSYGYLIYSKSSATEKYVINVDDFKEHENCIFLQCQQGIFARNNTPS